MSDLNAGHLKSFIDVPKNHHFPIQNLPYGVFQADHHAQPRVGVAIGDWVLDLSILEEHGLIKPSEAFPVFNQDNLNSFVRLGAQVWRQVREQVSLLLRHDTATLRDNSQLREQVLLKQSDVTMLLPMKIGDYTDFYASKEHATNVGTMFRGPENALPPNWLHLPIGYHGRASSIIPTGQKIRRPHGQVLLDGKPQYQPSQRLDFELEMAFFVGKETALGETVRMQDAEEHIFGMVLMNDWSARDIQKWEYVPLGPFLGKSFATSISPWVVTMDALEPFKTKGPEADQPLLPYLEREKDQHYDIHLEVFLQSEHLSVPHKLCQSNYKYLYWDSAQQLAHHTVNGCNMRIGDLLATGTISGPEPENFGSLLELSWNGERPISLEDGTSRTFIQDGDTLMITGWSQAKEYRIGFGEVSGTIIGD